MEYLSKGVGSRPPRDGREHTEGPAVEGPGTEEAAAMKCAVIDIGSNSMRLTVYDAEKTSFKILFREKVMAGLAGYVEKGRLTAEGIACACSGLLEFRETLEVLGIG